MTQKERDCVNLHDKRAISCRVCGMGPCRVVPKRLEIPNRLKGATMLENGDVT